MLRLFQSGLAAQVSWLLPFALIGMAATAARRDWLRPHTNVHRGVILWGGWLLTCAVFFSVAGFFHQYYLAMMGAPLAAIVAMSVVWTWQLRRTNRVCAALVFLMAAGATLAWQVYAAVMYQTLGWWLVVPVALGVIGTDVLLASLRRPWQRRARPGVAALTVAILVVPTVWSGLTTTYADTSSAMTQAYSGNTQQGGIRQPAMDGTTTGSTSATAQPVDGGMGGGINQNLLSYLKANTEDVKYLLVVPSSGAGAEYVLATGRPVLYAGGFGGSDPVIDGTDLAELVANSTVRYVLWGGGGPGGSTNSSITTYLQSSCTVVTDAGLGTATGTTTTQTTDGRGGIGGGASTLYQCGV